MQKEIRNQMFLNIAELNFDLWLFFQKFYPVN